jgi:TRAP transporter TAXI family solute receptor
MPMVAEAIDRLDAKLVPIAGPEADQLVAAFPFITQRTISAGVYGELPPLQTLAVGAQWLTTESLDEKLAYDLLRVLFAPRTLERLRAAHPQGKEINLATALTGRAVPLHRGAERFYQERSLLRG